MSIGRRLRHTLMRALVTLCCGCGVNENAPQKTCYDDGASFDVGKSCQSPGACGAGKLECAGPFSTRCSSGPEGSDSGAEPESCDAADNDCDSIIDEGCECQSEDPRSCGLSLGECEPGTQSCVDGRWSECMGGVLPDLEICDTLDNDCDGDIDEGCECEPDAVRSCGLSLGECESGSQSCVDGRWSECMGGVLPDLEICDTLDNDCDGDVDEGCECTSGETRGCGSDEGACTPGEQSCEEGRWGTCQGGEAPEPELCDLLDNDCDGDVDEGFALGSPCDAEGACPRSRVCSLDGSSSVCLEDASLFSDEVCDAIDNDCDGLVDYVIESGSLASACECDPITLKIGDADDVSNDANLCAETKCGPDFRPRLSIDGTCYAICLTDSDPDDDGWGFENGTSCLMEGFPPALSATLCPGDDLPVGMTITYCLDCDAVVNLPYAMCQSVPRYDLTAFAQGKEWLRVSYTYAATGTAAIPVNLWFHAGGDLRKYLPLVQIGDEPGPYEKLLRVDEACFTASESFGNACLGAGESCSHCGSNDVCGAISQCGDYDLSEAWLQVAAEFCPPSGGEQQGTVTVHSVELVDPTCQ